jgi:hypothetical protein
MLTQQEINTSKYKPTGSTSQAMKPLQSDDAEVFLSMNGMRVPRQKKNMTARQQSVCALYRDQSQAQRDGNNLLAHLDPCKGASWLVWRVFFDPYCFVFLRRFSVVLGLDHNDGVCIYHQDFE